MHAENQFADSAERLHVLVVLGLDEGNVVFVIGTGLPEVNVVEGVVFKGVTDLSKIAVERVG